MAILDVASRSGDNPVKLADISARQVISLRYLEQIFAQLKKANLVSAIKGPGGGYILNVDAKNLKIMDIIDAINENTKMTRCSVDKSCRVNGEKCMTHDLWKGLGNQIRAYFTDISVADVLGAPKG